MKTKNLSYLLSTTFFFVLFILTLTFTQPVEMTCTSQPMNVYNLIITLVSFVFLALAVMFFTFYFRETFGVVNVVGIIPVRMSSTRFPGKPLAKINGIPMVGLIYQNAKKCESLNEVYVATPDKEIMDYITTIGGISILTSDKHERATERVAEAVKFLENSGNKYDIIVMIQGDEPMVTSGMIDEALQPIIKGEAEIVNLMYKLSEEDKKDKNEVKVVVDKDNFALLYTRYPVSNMKQVCVIPFTRDMLFKYVSLEPTPQEKEVSVDMYRFLENGIKIKMVETKTETFSVDTKEDLKFVEGLMKK